MSEQRTLLMLAVRCSSLERQLDHYQNVNALLADAAHLSPAERDIVTQLLELIDSIGR